MERSPGSDRAAGRQTPSRDDVFEALSDRRRRDLLAALVDREDGRATVEDLVATVVARESEREGGAAEDRRAVSVSVYHHHVPALEGAGIVDHEDGVVELAVDPAVLEPCLGDSPEPGFPWELYFPAVSAGAVAVVVVGWALSPLGVPGVAWGALAVGVLALSSVAFLYDARVQ